MTRLVVGAPVVWEDVDTGASIVGVIDSLEDDGDLVCVVLDSGGTALVEPDRLGVQ